MYSLVYSWIDNELQIGPTLAFMLWLSDFETKTSFGFLIKKNRGFILIFSKIQKMSSFDQKCYFWRFWQKFDCSPIIAI